MPVRPASLRSSATLALAITYLGSTSLFTDASVLTSLILFWQRSWYRLLALVLSDVMGAMAASIAWLALSLNAVETLRRWQHQAAHNSKSGTAK